VVWKRKFPSFEEAIAYLEERGKLTFFGWNGLENEYAVYNYQHHDGRRFHVNVYKDGKIEVRWTTGWHS